jgi:secernin
MTDMCDTIVALQGATATGGVLFGKNSDRERNEAQGVEFVAGAEHADGARVVCTYIDIPQAQQTFAVLLCRPFWIWGAEMGANEHGVVIGNEAVHARIPPQQQDALLGMDLLRLALERAASAAQAVEVVTTLLEQFGQGGSCGHLAPRFYHNSFIIADPREAYVLETVGRMWAVERASGGRSISNAYSIGRGATRVSAGLIDHARTAGWCRDTAELDVASAFSDMSQDAITQGRARCMRSTALLQRSAGRLRAVDMMAILRDHGATAETDPDWHPQDAPNRTICMHAADSDRGGQTVGSLISELQVDRIVHWVTATAAPCTSIFKPVLPGVAIPAHGPRPTDRFNSRALWWRHEQLHRAILGEFPIHVAAIRAERDALEAAFRTRIDGVLIDGSDADRTQAVAECWADADTTERRWLAGVGAVAERMLRPGYRASWRAMNRLAGLEQSEAAA